MDDTREQEFLEQARQLLADHKKLSPETSEVPDFPPDRVPLDPVTKKKTWQNLMFLEQEYLHKGPAGLKNAYDQLFPEE